MSLDQAVVVIEVSSFSILTKYTRVCTLAAFYLSWLLGDQLFIFLSLPQKLFLCLKEAEQPSNFSLGICWFLCQITCDSFSLSVFYVGPYSIKCLIKTAAIFLVFMRCV